VKAIERNRLGHPAHLATGSDQAKPHIPIFIGTQALVKEANFFLPVTPQQNTPNVQRIIHQELRPVLRQPGIKDFTQRLAILVDQNSLPGGKPQLRLTVKSIYQERQFFRQKEIIGVQITQVCAGSVTNTGISCCRKARIILVDVTQPSVSETVCHCPGVVSGTVVNHDDLKIRVGLIQHALDGLAQIMALVVGWNDNAYCGHISIP